jgi:hypothetical protein
VRPGRSPSASRVCKIARRCASGVSPKGFAGPNHVVFNGGHENEFLPGELALRTSIC